MAGRSGCSSSFSRLARRSLGLRPALSRCHQFVTRYPKASAISFPPQLLRLLPAGAVAGWVLHPLESAALPRRTPQAVIYALQQGHAWAISALPCSFMPLPRPEHYCRVFLSAAAVNLKRSPRQIPSAGTPVDTQDFTEHYKIGWRRHYKVGWRKTFRPRLLSFTICVTQRPRLQSSNRKFGITEAIMDSNQSGRRRFLKQAVALDGGAAGAGAAPGWAVRGR